jgi:hypothetical protein
VLSSFWAQGGWWCAHLNHARGRELRLFLVASGKVPQEPGFIPCPSASWTLHRRSQVPVSLKTISSAMVLVAHFLCGLPWLLLNYPCFSFFTQFGQQHFSPLWPLHCWLLSLYGFFNFYPHWLPLLPTSCILPTHTGWVGLMGYHVGESNIDLMSDSLERPQVFMWLWVKYHPTLEQENQKPILKTLFVIWLNVMISDYCSFQLWEVGK